MRFFKYFLIFVFFFMLLSVIYSYILSPRIKIINHKNYDLKLFRGESRADSTEPTSEEVDRMLNSTVIIEPNSSYSFSISREYVFSKKDSKLNTSLKISSRADISHEFSIQNEGFCRYEIIVSDEYTTIESSKLPWCYKKLKLSV